MAIARSGWHGGMKLASTKNALGDTAGDIAPSGEPIYKGGLSLLPDCSGALVIVRAHILPGDITAAMFRGVELMMTYFGGR